MADWYPNRLADRIVWHANFSAQAAVSGTSHGLTAGQVITITADAAEVAALANYVGTDVAFGQGLTEFKNIMLDGLLGAAMPPVPAPPALYVPTAAAPAIQARTRQFAALIRATLTYTPEIGELYGIVAPVGAAPLGDPAFTAVTLPNSEVRLDWIKLTADGVIVEGQRAAEVAWTNLGTDRFSPYLDGREPLVAVQPEVRRYRMRYLIGDDPVGNYSPTVTVTTVP